MPQQPTKPDRDEGHDRLPGPPARRSLLDHHGGHRLRNVNELMREHLTPGQRIADTVAQVIGSWPFIIVQTAILIAWLVLNVIGWIHHWDPYPFILLNLALSFQAAYSAPIIMMSQNRQAAKDRLAAEHDYHVNVHAEEEVAAIRDQLADLAGRQWDALVDLQREQLVLLTRIEHLTTEVHRLTQQQRDASNPDGTQS